MMTPFLLYLLRASLYLALFYAFFLLVMRRTSLFRFNRAALLAGTVICHLLPLLPLRTVIIPEITIPVSPQTLEAVTEPAGASAPPFPWLSALYAAGLLAVLLLCLISVVRTRRVIRSGVTEKFEGCRLTLTERDIPSFSWGRHIVMSRADYERYPAILAHERQHVQRHHSLDVALMTAVAALHWFNPLVWITRAELKLLHEYEADERLIQQGIDATQYQLLLVRKAVGEQRFSLANGFDHAKLKQRINMMQRKPSSGWMRLAYAGILPLLAGTMFLCNPVRAEIRPSTSDASVTTASATKEVPDSTSKVVPFSQVTKKPTFQGNDASTFAKWVSENMTYPEDAKKAGVEGRVMVQFTICEDGAVRDIKLLRSVDPRLDAEAVRVISASPKWTPGEQNGKPVQVSYMFPVIFQVKGNGNAPTVISVETRSRQDGATVNVRSVSGEPMGDIPVPTIRVRGPEGSEPLVFIDGVKVTDGIKALQTIDPSTIESIDVLKDPVSLELYGEEGKNGVILIHTKK